MAQLTGRQDAPVLLLTKLHPPFVAAQTIARERLFERLRAGRGLRLSLVACPAGFGKSTLLAAWREREAERRPVAWVTLDEGDDDAVVLWSHVIEALGARLPGARRARDLSGDGRRRAGAGGRAAAARQRAASSRATSRSCSTTSTGSRARRRARQRRVVRRPPAVDVQLVLVHAQRPAAAARRAARARASCSSCAPTSCASRSPEAERVPQRPARARARRRPTSSCSSRAPRAGRPASTSRRCRSPGSDGPARRS